MTNPIKLTDELLGEIEAAVYDMHTIEGRGRELMRAIRTLRDRARAVCEDSLECFGDSKGDSLVNNQKLDALREVLPEVKP